MNIYGENKDRFIKQCKVEPKKFSIISVVSPTHSVAVPLLNDRNFTLVNDTPGDKFINKAIKFEPTSPKKPEVYQQRKSMLLEYKELFAALMKLPDRELQQKLLDVINNHRTIKYRTIETQTDHVEFHTSVLQGEAAPTANYESESSLSNKKGTNGTGKKRKRKRKVSLPQANKESRAKKLAKINNPQTTNLHNINTKIQFKCNPIKRQRNNSVCISECNSDVVNIFEDTEEIHSMEIDQCFVPLECGLLPIQDAVVRNQINKLNLYISRWRAYRGVDMNDILTDDDEDLLQLAVLNTCDPSIVSLLLEKGLNPNSLDADSNTVVHMAILNDIAVASMDKLMNHIDLKLLLTLNDDGYSPLHLAVRQDRYLLAECLINVLDERLVKKVFYKLPVDELETDEIVLKGQFKDYYENICVQMPLDENIDSYAVSNHELKQRLLQVGDRKSGNTALYFAIDQGFEHLIYFLLAHLTDPRIENLSGIDCKSYISEFGKSLNLSLKIDNAMEKIIKLLS